ncbi:hypothetical protein LCGC14_2284670 [marine sediment metagenome]|uniref:Uncharacterized protein n=1 Tax=marine sediment metagenome TaxID=412755 RepID=A0A0F9CTH4_9ZZZZ
MLRKIKVTIEATAIMPEHLVNRLEGMTGKRDRKDLAQMVIEDDGDPIITITENKQA